MGVMFEAALVVAALPPTGVEVRAFLSSVSALEGSATTLFLQPSEAWPVGKENAL